MSHLNKNHIAKWRKLLMTLFLLMNADTPPVWQTLFAQIMSMVMLLIDFLAYLLVVPNQAMTWLLLDGVGAREKR
jgi:hypothetical protein